ncbi:MAG: hypothetical protein ABIK90_03485 [candidate division WOR-3 bacterium]
MKEQIARFLRTFLRTAGEKFIGWGEKPWGWGEKPFTYKDVWVGVEMGLFIIGAGALSYTLLSVV